MIIGINPSSQGFNRVGSYNEAIACNDIAQRVRRIGNEQGLDIRVYWGGNQRTGSANISGIRKSIAAAKADKVKYFLSFHTDSAGDKRGYTGSLLLYLNNWGKIFGETVANAACEASNIPFYATRRRTNLLVLKSFQTIPCALIEIANHSDPDDLKLLLDPAWRELYAQGLVEGLLKYLGKSYNKEGEIEVSSFQAVPTGLLASGLQKHIWFDGLFTGKGDFGKGRVFVTIRMDEDNKGGTYKYCIIAKNKKIPIRWTKELTIEPDNRPVEFEVPKDIGNFSLHLLVKPDTARVRVSVNQMYK